MDFQDQPVTVAPIEDGFRLTFVGPIHINTSWIEGEMDKVVTAKPKVVELDLLKTEYISSHGLGVLISFNNRIRAGGGILTIVKLPKVTYRLLKTAHLDSVFKIDLAGIVEPPPPAH